MEAFSEKLYIIHDLLQAHSGVERGGREAGGERCGEKPPTLQPKQYKLLELPANIQKKIFPFEKKIDASVCKTFRYFVVDLHKLASKSNFSINFLCLSNSINLHSTFTTINLFNPILFAQQAVPLMQNWHFKKKPANANFKTTLQ